MHAVEISQSGENVSGNVAFINVMINIGFYYLSFYHLLLAGTYLNISNAEGWMTFFFFSTVDVTHIH